MGKTGVVVETDSRTSEYDGLFASRTAPPYRIIKLGIEKGSVLVFSPRIFGLYGGRLPWYF